MDLEMGPFGGLNAAYGCLVGQIQPLHWIPDGGLGPADWPVLCAGNLLNYLLKGV